MPIGDMKICRVYECSEDDCSCQIVCEEFVKDEWQTKCPFCKKKSLLLKSASLNMSIMVDLSKPKTLGSLGEQNAKRIAKEGKLQKEDKIKPPFWRKNKKINYKILRDPKRYIESGYA